MTFLPDSIVNSDKIEEVLGLLAKHNVVIEESAEDDSDEKKESGEDGTELDESEEEPGEQANLTKGI